jgi:Arc/MetJ family transcription regulator
MARRTTLEIDEGLLSRAQAALGAATIRATVEEALRRVLPIRLSSRRSG